jgi:hypothetical protein
VIRQIRFDRGRKGKNTALSNPNYIDSPNSSRGAAPFSVATGFNR